MEMRVHNKLGVNYDKSVSTITYIANTFLGKFVRKSKWKFEVRLDEKKSANKTDIICGITLLRPNKNSIYVKKAAGNLYEAAREGFKVIQKLIRREGKRWNREDDLVFVNP